MYALSTISTFIRLKKLYLKRQEAEVLGHCAPETWLKAYWSGYLSDNSVLAKYFRARTELGRSNVITWCGNWVIGKYMHLSADH